MLDGSRLTNVSMQQFRISDANLSDLQIDGAQLGGARFENIGMPTEGHPYYNPSKKHRPVSFTNCDLNNSTFRDCNLSGVSITECNTTGMTIDGIPLSDLLAAYRANPKK